MTSATDLLPRRRFAGPLVLDLLVRDARVGKGWIGLHPREFELLWRLSDTPGVAVSRAKLLRDVWRLEHLPETNTLEVHVCRLRAKLAPVGLAWLVATGRDGGYLLDAAAGSHVRERLGDFVQALDSRALIGDEGLVSQ